MSKDEQTRSETSIAREVSSAISSEFGGSGYYVRLGLPAHAPSGLLDLLKAAGWQGIEIPAPDPAKVDLETALSHALASGQPVHLLHLGHGLDVTQRLPALGQSGKPRPAIIVVEGDDGAKTEANLVAPVPAGYRLAYAKGKSGIFVSTEHGKLQSAIEAALRKTDAPDGRSPEPSDRPTADKTEQAVEDLTVTRERVAGLKAELNRNLGEVERYRQENTALRMQLELQERERQAILQSTSWRLLGVLRRAANKVPPRQRSFLRRALKAAWWLATPWRIPARLRQRRASNVPAGAESIPTMLDALSPAGSAALDVAKIAPGIGGTSRPIVSFLLLADGDHKAAARTLESFRTQTALRSEAVISGPGREAHELVRLSSASCDIRYAGPSSGPAGLNDALLASRGFFVCVLRAGDIVADGALRAIAARLTVGAFDIAYGDEEIVPSDGGAPAPYLKPCWSPELLTAFNYFGRLTLLDRSLALRLGGFDENAGSAAEWDMNLRASDLAQTIARIPEILCRRRPGDAGDRPAPDSLEAADARRVIETYWRRRGLLPHAETTLEGTQAVTWPLPHHPRVSIIIPTKDKANLLGVVMSGILEKTDYPDLEVVIVDTGSSEDATHALYGKLRRDHRVVFVEYRRQFNYSAACNDGAAVATGDILLFLNNDIEIITPDWITEMVRFAMLPGVGVVGTRLFYPSREPQHGGVVLGPNLVTLTYQGHESAGWGVFGSPNHPRNWLAIMGACQMVTREVFDAVGGFDEAYQIAVSDISLCMAVWRAGYRTAYAPAAALIHHEGATRGHTNPPADMARLADDIRRFGIDGDPYLHPDLDGTSPNPRHRTPSGLGAYEALKRNVARTGSFVEPKRALDLWDDGACLAAADLPREAVFWWPQAAHKVVDVWSAARWCLDLLRCRADIRARFPTALSDGIEGPFARWLIAEGTALFGLPDTLEATLRDLFAAKIAGRARRAFLWRDDVRARWPQGLTPVGRREVLRWFLRDGRREENIRLEEIWWLLWSAAERPEQELVWAYLLTPAWQTSFPDAMSRFGAERFSRWFAAAFNVEETWTDPSRWPLPGTASDQIRVGYVAHQRWRELHPDALVDETAARTFLAWLLEQNALAPWARGWLETLDLGAVAVELARPGANMIGHFRYPSGLRVSAESIAEGLAAVGAGVSLRDARTQPNDDPGHELVSGLEIYDTTILHLQPEPLFDAAYLRADLAERRPSTYRIAYWYWEFDTIPESWREQAEKADEVWAASEFVAKGLRERLDVPVRTEFPGLSLAPFHPRPRSHFALPEEEFVFLFTFHMMSVMERKNPLGLIRAFKRVFKEPEPARLVIKTSFGQRYPDQLAALQEAAEGARITIIDEIYSPEDVLALTDVCDVYVSLHRSEGLGLTMAEAMLLGKPVIATAYSGNMEFMTPENSLLVDYHLVRLGEMIPPYEADYHWAEPSEQHAAELMRRLFDDRALARDIGARAKADATERLSVVAAGHRMAARLAEIQALRKSSRHSGIPT